MVLDYFVGGAGGDLWPKSNTTIRSQVEVTRGTSCSTTTTPMPMCSPSLRMTAENLGFVGVEAGGGFVEEQHGGLGHHGSSDADEAGSALGQRGGLFVEDVAKFEQVDDFVDDFERGVRPGWMRSRKYRRRDWSSAATRRLSRTESPSKSSTPCQERPMPARADVRATRCRWAGRLRRMVPDCWRVKPVTVSNRVVLPAPLGPIRPSIFTTRGGSRS